MRKAFKFITELADGIGFAFEDSAKYLGRSIINKPVKWGAALGVRLAPKREKAKSAGLAIAAFGTVCALSGGLGALILVGLGGASLSLGLVALGAVLLPPSIGFGMGLVRVGENLMEGRPMNSNDDDAKKANVPAPQNDSRPGAQTLITAKSPQGDFQKAVNAVKKISTNGCVRPIKNLIRSLKTTRQSSDKALLHKEY